MNRRLRQVELCLGQPDVLDRLGGGHRHEQRLRIRHADILAGEDHHPAGDEPGVLAGLEHPRQPVDGGVGVRAAHRLDERADDVVVVVAPVAERARAERRLGVFQADGAGMGEGARHFERRQDLPAVASRPIDQQVDRLGGRGRALRLEATGDERSDRRLVERLEPEQRRAAAQRRVDLEERVLGGGTDHGQRAVLDRRQQSVLLSLVEAVDLVEEEDRALTALAEPLAGAFDDLADVLHPRGDRRQLLARPGRRVGDRQCEGRLAGAGRPPEDRRRQPVLFDEPSQRAARADQVILADDVVDRARAEAGGERSRRPQPRLRRRAEQVAHDVLSTSS